MSSHTIHDYDNEYHDNDVDHGQDDALNGSAAAVSTEQQLHPFHRDAHTRYFKSMLLNVLPSAYQEVDSSRMTVLYFSLVGLDILGVVDELDCKESIIEFIYSLQIDPTAAAGGSVDIGRSGFIGGSFLNTHLCAACSPVSTSQYCSPTTDSIADRISRMNITESCELADFHQGHLAMTYTSLVSLITLGDDLRRVNRVAIIAGDSSTSIMPHAMVMVETLVPAGLKLLQTSNGSFQATLADTSDHDVRFLFCACAISAALDDWSGVDKDKAVAFIRSCITYEGGIALLPGTVVLLNGNVLYGSTKFIDDACVLVVGAEAQGGASYCAIASLSLMNRLDALSASERSCLSRWCEARYGCYDVVTLHTHSITTESNKGRKD